MPGLRGARLLVLLALVSGWALGGAPVHAQTVLLDPEWFTETGASWGYRYTGSDPGFVQAVDPDASGSGTWVFSDPQNPTGTVRPNIPSWLGHFSDPADPQPPGVVGLADELLFAVHRRTDDPDIFTVFLLAFAGGDTLEGEYATCGEPAFTPNTPGPVGRPVYGEGRIRLQRGSLPAAPARPPELYGVDGVITGENPLCDRARQTPAFWQNVPTPDPPDDDRRATTASVACNRGPAPGDPFACTATVGDSDVRPGATAPAGTVALTATTGALGAASCVLAPSSTSPSVSSCAFTYVNAAVGVGAPPPVTAGYPGSPVHRPSSGTTTPAVPVDPPPEPGQTPAICGAAPLPSCVGIVDPPASVQTCVANVVGACLNPAQAPGTVQTCVANVVGSCTGATPPPSPLRICIGNVTGACSGFAGGAKLAGVVDDTTVTGVELSCPETTPGTALGRPACETDLVLTASEARLVELWSAALRSEIRLRYAVYKVIKPLLPSTLRVNQVISVGLTASIKAHNARLDEVNALVRSLDEERRKELSFVALRVIRYAGVPLGDWSIYAVGPGDTHYFHPSYDGPHDKTKSLASQRRRPTRTAGFGPSRKGLKLRTVTVARQRLTIRAGARRRINVRLTKQGRALVAASVAARRPSLRLTTSVTMRSTTGAFGVSTAKRTAALQLRGSRR